MPPGAVQVERQLALISRIHHERLTDPEIGKLLEDLEKIRPELDAAARRLPHPGCLQGYSRAVRVPSEFVARMEEHQANSFEVWKRARRKTTTHGAPLPPDQVDLSRELAGFFPGFESVPIPHRFHGRGIHSVIFEEALRRADRQARALVTQSASGGARYTFLMQHYPVEDQRALVRP